MLSARTPPQRALVKGENSAALSLAALLAHHGYETTLMEEDASGVARSKDFLKRFYEGNSDWQVGISKPTILPFDQLNGRFDILVDAGNVGLEERLQTLNRLSKNVMPSTLIAFQTTMPDAHLSKKLDDTFPAIHQFHLSGQPHLAALVERAEFQDIDNDEASQFWQSLGKKTVNVKPDGRFVASRLSAKLYETLDTLLLEGSLPFEVDEALVAFGFSIGPYEAQDLSGLDAPYYERKQLKLDGQQSCKASAIPDRMVQEGRLGKKVGVGWYRYPGGGGAVIDPLLEDLIVEEAYFAKIKRRTITDQEVVSRVVSSLIDEATLILEKGIVATAADLDKLSVQALDFPHGGICAYAGQHLS